MNAAAERMLGWTENELLGHDVSDLIHRRRPDGAPPPADDGPLTAVFRHRRTVRSREDTLVRRDGRILPVLCSASPEVGGGMVIAFSDVTEEIEKRRRRERRLDSVSWVSRVREALDEDRLELHSQTILPLRGGAAREELLLRMISRDGELVNAGAFLPAAEELGLIFEIDSWVIARAARFAAPAGNVVFEVAEAALVSSSAVGEAFATQLRELGCGLPLDDFGNGAGGFAYLRRLSVQTLKIDIDFVRDLPGSPANQHLVQAIVGLARGFDVETIAGGVEDLDTLALLREFGVDCPGLRDRRHGPRRAARRAAGGADSERAAPGVRPRAPAARPAARPPRGAARQPRPRPRRGRASQRDAVARSRASASSGVFA